MACQIPLQASILDGLAYPFDPAARESSFFFVYDGDGRGGPRQVHVRAGRFARVSATEREDHRPGMAAPARASPLLDMDVLDLVMAFSHHRVRVGPDAVQCVGPSVRHVCRAFAASLGRVARIGTIEVDVAEGVDLLSRQPIAGAWQAAFSVLLSKPCDTLVLRMLPLRGAGLPFHFDGSSAVHTLLPTVAMRSARRLELCTNWGVHDCASWVREAPLLASLEELALGQCGRVPVFPPPGDIDFMEDLSNHRWEAPPGLRRLTLHRTCIMDDPYDPTLVTPFVPCMEAEDGLAWVNLKLSVLVRSMVSSSVREVILRDCPVLNPRSLSLWCPPYVIGGFLDGCIGLHTLLVHAGQDWVGRHYGTPESPRVVPVPIHTGA